MESETFSSKWLVDSVDNIDLPEVAEQFLADDIVTDILGKTITLITNREDTLTLTRARSQPGSH